MLALIRIPLLLLALAFSVAHNANGSETGASEATAAPPSNAQPKTAQSAQPLDFEDCDIGDTGSHATMAAECTTLDVSLIPGDNTSETITLHIARLKSTDRHANQPPITLIAGGPGQSALSVFPGIQSAFTKIRNTRDIYLIDQRGTGRSNALVCEPDSGEDIDPFQFDRQTTLEDASRCVAQLNSDPRYFTTSVAVQDLEAVRAALGLPQWSLYGVSYGTRVALHYLKRYPERVHSLILDAVVPPEVSLGASIPLDAQRAFELISERCEQTAACNERFPDLATRTGELIQSLRDTPRTVTFENFTTGQLDTMAYSDVHLSLTIRLMAYSSYGASLLPVLLHGAYENDHFAPLARQAALQLSSQRSGIATGMHSAVICTEDIPYMNIDDDLRADIDNTWLGYTPLAAARASCEPWPTGVIDDDFKEPVVSDVPVLILSGEVDPVTPPGYGDTVATTLSNARHIIMEGQGHMQAFLGCMPAIMAEFLMSSSAAELDTSCLARQSPAPFFVDANGPLP